MGTILAPTSQADSATTTTPGYAFAPDDIITALVANGAPPNQFCQVQLQLFDGANWHAVDTRWAGGEAGLTYVQKFELADYVQLAQVYGITAWQQFRLYFTGNVGAAVTISATDADPVEMAVVPLTPTTLTTGGAVGVWTPPGGQPVIITRIVVDVTVPSTGAANVNAGVGTSPTTSYSNILPASAVNAAGVVDSVTASIRAASANEAALQSLAVLVPAGNVVTFTGSASTVGMTATAYIEYIKP